jgi:Na+-driven multidrug efflux pump
LASQRGSDPGWPEPGAGKPDRAEAAAWKAGFYNMLCLGAIGAVFLLFAPQLVAFFTDDPAVATYAVRCLRIVAAGFPFYGYQLVLSFAFNGAGDPWTPTWINLGCMWLLELPLSWALAHPLGFGPTACSSPSTSRSRRSRSSAECCSRGEPGKLGGVTVTVKPS